MLEHIQLDQKTINEELLGGVLATPKWWLPRRLVPDCGRIHGSGRFRLYDEQGPGRNRTQQAGVLGILPGQLRVLDRHQPRGDNDLRDSEADAGRMATPGDARRRGNDGVFADGRAAHAAVPRGQAVARLLGCSHTTSRAECGRMSAPRSCGTRARL